MKKIAVKSSIDNPSIKDLIDMERWALMNNLHVHPAFLKALKIRNRMLIYVSMLTVIILLIVIRFVIKLVFGMDI